MNLILLVKSAAIQGSYTYYNRVRQDGLLKHSDLDDSLLINSGHMWREEGPLAPRLGEMKKAADRVRAVIRMNDIRHSHHEKSWQQVIRDEKDFSMQNETIDGSSLEHHSAKNLRHSVIIDISDNADHSVTLAQILRKRLLKSILEMFLVGAGAWILLLIVLNNKYI